MYGLSRVVRPVLGGNWRRNFSKTSVVITARNTGKIQDLVDLNSENALALELDVNNKEQVKAAAAISDYAETAGANQDGMSGNQPGDPVRAVKAIIKAVESENPPLWLLLGKAALNNGRLKLDDLKNDFDAWAETSEGADFPGSKLAQAK